MSEVSKSKLKKWIFQMALKSKENDLKRWVTPKKHINFKAAKQFARCRMVPLLPLIMVVTRNCFEAITGKEKTLVFS